MISLSALLHSFSAPVTEEHAWALIYQVKALTYLISHILQWLFQAISTLQSLLGNSELRELFTVGGTEV